MPQRPSSPSGRRGNSRYIPSGNSRPTSSRDSSDNSHSSNSSKKRYAPDGKSRPMQGGKKHGGKNRLTPSGKGRQPQSAAAPIEMLEEVDNRFATFLKAKAAPALAGPENKTGNPDEMPVARTGAQVAEPLATLPYAQELQFKNEALREFWKATGLPDKPNLVVPSPKPRGYRTTSKRRINTMHGEVRYDFKPEGRTSGSARLGSVSALEPETHARIFDFILAKLNTPAYAPLTRSLNFVVVRGDYERFALILNVQRTSADVVRKAKLLAGQFEREPALGVIAAWLFHGDGHSPFYLDQTAPTGQWKAKRLFGPEQFSISVGEAKYDFHPLGFSQINLSLLPKLIADTLESLKLRREERLIDLYCGYGLFSLAAAPHVAEVIGIDAAEKAIPAARAMAASRKFNHARFLRDTLHARSLEKLLPPPGDRPEVVLLDPPKSGAGVGVIRSIAARAPRRVVQLFCGMDALAKDCDSWRRAGYMLAKAVPYDMFPGTDEIELLTVFVPDKFGLLNRTPPPAHVQPHAAMDAQAQSEKRTPKPMRKPVRPQPKDSSRANEAGRTNGQDKPNRSNPSRPQGRRPNPRGRRPN
jgi:tRNA/tmRNA/rRNA uracil-C5-methylase (TrmA/RlmC/RlmD family)